MNWRRWHRKWKIWSDGRKLYGLFGLAGVSTNETRLARVWGRFFSYASVLVAIVLLLQWQWELLNEFSTKEKLIYNWVVWVYFVLQYSILIAVVNNKARYIRQNWFLPLVILFGLVFIFHYERGMLWFTPLRPLLAIAVLVPSISLLAQFFIDGKLRTTLLATAIIVVIFGVLVSGVDENIHNFWDGIWWAVATVSTVGYGDVVPTSELGRLLGIGLIVLGLGVFVVITANFLALTLRRETKKFKEEEREVQQILREVEDLKETQHEILTLLKSLKRQKKDNK